MANINRDTVFDDMERDVQNSSLSERDKNKMLKNILHLREQEVNILITGATGCGKSQASNGSSQA